METSKFNVSDIDIFRFPARLIIAGYSNSGKSQLCEQLIRREHEKFEVILYCGVDIHPLQDNEVIHSKLIVSRDILNPFEYCFSDKKILYVLDDCFLEAAQDKNVVDAFTKGRHSGISIIFITQNVFFNGKYARHISLNCSHYVLMRMRDFGQIENLGRQLYGKGKGKEFTDIYKKALSENKYGYLLVDLGPETPEELQLRTNIIGETIYQIVYQW